jgi:hypothetical protein
VAGVLALALAMHKLPGFNNPLLLDRVVLSDGAAPFTLYANFDKGAVGLVLLALLCRRVHRGRAARVLRRTAPVLALTVAATLGIALALGGRPRRQTAAACAAVHRVNLLFTVVAEEAFFRGFLQARLAGAGALQLGAVAGGAGVGAAVRRGAPGRRRAIWHTRCHCRSRLRLRLPAHATHRGRHLGTHRAERSAFYWFHLSGQVTRCLTRLLPARLPGAVAGLVGTATVLALLYFGRDVLIPITLAFILSFLIAPFVRALRHLGLGQTTSVCTACWW